VLTYGPRGHGGEASVKGLDAVERLGAGGAEDAGGTVLRGVSRPGSSSRTAPTATAGSAPLDGLPASFSSSSPPEVTSGRIGGGKSPIL
jgi:hypothetical protein